MVFLKKLGSNFSGLFTSDQIRKKTRYSCLLQTFNSSKHGPLTLVLSHARLNKITQSGLIIPLLLGFFKIPAWSHTNTYTPILPPFFVKIIKVAKQISKSWKASTFQQQHSTPNFFGLYRELLPSSLLYGHLLLLQDPGFSQQWRKFLEISSAICSSPIKQVFPLITLSL